MSRSVLTAYTAHRAAIAARTGGESGEWPDIAAALATILEDRVGELPLDWPLRQVFAAPPRVLNGDWPILIVHHLRSASPDVPAQSDACWRKWRHDAQLLLVCGPWGAADPGAMEAMGTAYIEPITEVLDANQSLDGVCKHIEFDAAGATWQIVSYGPSQPFQSPPQWYALTVPIQIYGQAVRVRGV